ncbi:hypothetical protein D9619_004875 [Psilocybe cf. subviscida]|uniref:Uncharacterized protein n=1 Tax=Psilocybe cf. subviscida TaxID=2480587 RepID=A0A8H5F844_9AGAR|nr:hypothetical protein D9619_004875 [Psilocybe cf. subviscida]
MRRIDGRNAICGTVDATDDLPFSGSGLDEHWRLEFTHSRPSQRYSRPVPATSVSVLLATEHLAPPLKVSGFRSEHYGAEKENNDEDEGKKAGYAETMSTSSDAVKLGLDTVLQVAKDTIKPGGWTCEWNVAPDLKTPEYCRLVLNSWTSYFKYS